MVTGKAAGRLNDWGRECTRYREMWGCKDLDGQK